MQNAQAPFYLGHMNQYVLPNGALVFANYPPQGAGLVQNIPVGVPADDVVMEDVGPDAPVPMELDPPEIIRY